MSSEQNKVTLAYWKIRGLAQPIRLLLEYAGIPYEDVKYEQGDAPDYSREAWLSVKHTLGLDFPNLPYLIDGDVKITQSNAILRHVARKANLYGETEKERAHVDLILEQTMDLRNKAVAQFYCGVRGQNYGETLPTYLESIKEQFEQFEKYLTGKTWFAGSEKVSHVFVLHDWISLINLLDNNYDSQR